MPTLCQGQRVSTLGRRVAFQRDWTACLTLWALAIWLLPIEGSDTDQIEFFEQRIRPILAQECYDCHSHRSKVKAGLELDSRPGWQAGGQSGPAIIPGDPENSLLFQAITHGHEDIHMPKSGAKLEDSVLADFKEWIAQGAVDPRDVPSSADEVAKDTDWDAIFERRGQWWSFHPLSSPEVPDSDRVLHPVDRFLEASRSGARLTVSPMANRWTVLRRLHYVLSGLPASEMEQQAFSEDWDALGRAKAVEKRIDLLLASERFGERWAQHWLDWFRYTEGHGGQGDPTNERATEFRDYIIRALNANIPYDQLIREHLAGDLLPEPRLDPSGTINESIIGLAQYRFVEHGFFPVDAQDELVKFTDNQIDVVSKATLGLTVSCARCHDHKFDPISQTDYHALFGIFASSRPGHRPILAHSVIDSRRDTLHRQREKLADEIRSHWLEISTEREIRVRLDRIAEVHAEAKKNKKEPVTTLSGIEPVPNHILVRPGDALEPWIRWKDEDIAHAWARWPAHISEQEKEAADHNNRITLETFDFRNGIPDDWLVTDGMVTAVKAGVLGLSVKENGLVESILPAGVATHATTTHEQAALFSPDFTIDFGALAANWSGAGWSLFRLVPENFPRGNGGIYRQNDSRYNGNTRWFSEENDFWNGRRGYFHFQTRLTSPAPPRGPPGSDGKPMPTKAEPHGSWFHVREVRKLRGESDRIRRAEFPVRSLLASGAATPVDRGSLARRYAEAIREVVERWRSPEFTDLDALFLTECIRAGLLDGDADCFSDPVRAALADIRNTEFEFAAIAGRSTPAVVESAGFDQPLYRRGNHQDPGAPVARGFLSVMNEEPFELEAETGRLRLADEIASKDNPLFSRVIANRIWYHVFGEGLVTTMDNFGRTGQQPSHPELLDHLASRIRNSGYNLKEAIRYLVTTDLFQLSSAPTMAARNNDPSNRHWTHARLRRFDAEVVRDHLLDTSGNLDPQLYGPSLQSSLPLEKDTRRGIYVERKRKNRNDFLDTFNMPLPASTRGKRGVTTTPSQAITMLNSPFVRHQAMTWAERHEQEPFDASLRALFRQALGRPPSEDEVTTSTEFYRENGSGFEGLAELAHLVFNAKEFIYLP